MAVCHLSPVKVALLAMEVSEAALSALAATSAALNCQEQRIEPLVKSRDSVQPVQPETPQLLPAVHTLWAPLLQALKVLPLPLVSVLRCCQSWAHFSLLGRLL